MQKCLVSLVTFITVSSIPFAAGAAPLPASAFGYDTSAPLGITIVGEHHIGPLTVRDITFASPKGGVVKAQIISPRTKVRGGGVLFVHWLGDAKTTNLTEFRRDAETLAPSRERCLAG